MKLAVITDPHANREALQAVLDHAEARAAAQYAFVGDLVGYGADPAWVVDCVRERVGDGALVVRGNHDEAVARGAQPTMHPDARYVVDWTRERLNTAQTDFLGALPLRLEFEGLLFVHANAWAPAEWGYIQSRTDAVRSMHATACAYTFCGHVHDPCLYFMDATGKAGAFQPAPEIDIPVPAHRQWLVVPGSAGQPRDGNPAVCYAMLDTDQAQLTFYRVPYDHEAAAAKIRAARLPQRLATRLAEGS